MSCTEAWHGRYALACGGVALLVLRRDNQVIREHVVRGDPEAKGLSLGCEFLVDQRDGGPHVYAVKPFSPETDQ